MKKAILLDLLSGASVLYHLSNTIVRGQLHRQKTVLNKAFKLLKACICNLMKLRGIIMYSAYRIDTKEIIYANEFDKKILKDYCDHSIIECPDCGSPLNVRSGSKKQHFYHVNSTCSYKISRT